MKYFVSFVLLVTILVFSKITPSQVIYSHKIDSVINLVSVQSISRMNKELSGDTVSLIGGIPWIIFSRYYLSPGNDLAKQYIYEKFQSYGLNAKYMINSVTNVNVYAEKIGIKYPNRKFIIGAHYDDEINPYPGINDTIYGADDNASGVCAVLEAARLLANMNLDYTVIFAAFDEEEPEPWLIGSKAFADSCYLRGDSICGVINLDMIGYDGVNDMKLRLKSDTNSLCLCESFINCNLVYQTGLNPYRFFGVVSDEQYFIVNGYRGMGVIEKGSPYFNPYYHTVEDRLDKFNIQFFYRTVKTSIATLLTWAMDKNIFINHRPLVDTRDTTSRLAVIEIKSPIKINIGLYQPRLYYKNRNEAYQFINAFSVIQDTFKFLIPGKPGGSSISYYFALQDSAGTITATLPAGGTGISPPGTTPPQNVFTYEIYSNSNQCSNTLPKPINDFELTNDTIQINQNLKIIDNIKVNLTIYHPNDGDLIIQLKGPDGMITLSQGNGSSGANYINTTFDDSASTPITQGTPPFTGSYKPQNPLSLFNNKSATGLWMLRVYDSKAGDIGSLVSWCILMQLKNNVSVKEQNIPVKYELSQNYPNPFNPTTIIKFQIKDLRFTTLKIYDILGKEVATLVNEKLKAGTYEVTFEGSNLASGIYFYQLKTDNFIETKKLILIK
ncbi:MAG: M28 family peptidase [Ignavibacteria bacterium]|jgi:subtilisin-like proprotein convertase family protein